MLVAWILFAAAFMFTIALSEDKDIMDPKDYNNTMTGLIIIDIIFFVVAMVLSV